MSKITFMSFCGIFNAFLKILHKIWKNHKNLSWPVDSNSIRDKDCMLCSPAPASDTYSLLESSINHCILSVFMSHTWPHKIPKQPASTISYYLYSVSKNVHAGIIIKECNLKEWPLICVHGQEDKKLFTTWI